VAEEEEANMDRRTTATTRRPFRLPIWLGFCVFLAIAIFLLWDEHKAHLLGALPWVLVALCPILHLLMHGGHGGHGQGSGNEDGRVARAHGEGKAS
jgi:hypothetical protein